MYREKALTVKARIIRPGIINKSVGSLSINIFSIAGSKSQAIEEVLPATKRENNIAIKICVIYFFV